MSPTLTPTVAMTNMQLYHLALSSIDPCGDAKMLDRLLGQPLKLTVSFQYIHACLQVQGRTQEEGPPQQGSWFQRALQHVSRSMDMLNSRMHQISQPKQVDPNTDSFRRCTAMWEVSCTAFPCSCFGSRNRMC